MANTYLTRTNGTPTDARKWTLSVWFKSKYDQDTGATQEILHSGPAGTDEVLFRLENDGTFNIKEDASSAIAWSFIRPNAKLRDNAAWYHLVATFDSTQATSTDRLKMWINGESVADNSGFDSFVAPSLNYEPILTKSGYDIKIGARNFDNANPFQGHMSHYHLTDGYAYDASAFGETDSTTGEWKIKTSPSVNYGNNGFFLFKDDASVNDQSGNGNNFTLSGTLTKSEDNPSNIFCTLNPTVPKHAADGNDDQSQTGVFSNGFNTWTSTNSVWNSRGSGTLFAKTGKFYYEVQWGGGSDPLAFAGISNPDVLYDNLGGTMALTGTYSYYGNGTMYEGSSSTASYGTAWSNTNDILGVAVDLDNSKIYYSVNGTWQNSADPGAGTGGITITGDTFYTPRCTIHNIALRFNFGNGYFGTTAVSSAGTNASGLGIFEYDVPTGFTAWCTKGLNE